MMSETHMEQKVDLDALQEHYNNAPLWDSSMDPVYSVLPALIAELRELRALTTPEPISEKHKDGNWWLYWDPFTEVWHKMRWRYGGWQLNGRNFIGDPAHVIPMPPEPEARP